MGYPRIVHTEEGMRDGLQIESADIPVAAKIRLLDALSGFGRTRARNNGLGGTGHGRPLVIAGHKALQHGRVLLASVAGNLLLPS